MINLPIDCIIDCGSEELAFQFKPLSAEVPANPQTGGNGVAPECALRLYDRTEVHLNGIHDPSILLNSIAY
ncbi:hypothetical protein [Nostoc sp.]|uniref:hypothetical protein n=1 Tax=Nostoc sp. TaxID=1180 RepID=UPI002FF4AA99